MFTIEKYKNTDADKILSWLSDEKSFRQWSADKYKTYPSAADDMNLFYDSISKDGAKQYMFCDEGKAIGHFVLRPQCSERLKTVRIGFIIVDTSVRGKGYGRAMLELAIPFVFDEFNAERITLGVFENNSKAKKCYESVGFNCVGATEYTISGEIWKCFEMEVLRRD